MIGECIAHYRIHAKLGEGGMGIVYRATDTRLDRDVAIKVLPADFARDPDRLSRFEREAKTLAAINHPNIAAIYGVEHGALVMELVEGPTLDDRLRSGALPLDEAIAIAKQIADALEAAHEKGIVHRDLKPANVKVTLEGCVKLLDFGLAKALETSQQGAIDPVNSPTVVARSMPGVIMGTAGYMAPEQAKGQPVDKRADIWAFGVVLYEMLTGRRLFDSGSIAEAIADVLRADIDLKALPAGTPPALATLLERCLDRNVRTRLRDIGEARILLSGPLTVPAPVQISTPVSARQTRSVWPWLVAVVVAAGIPIAWFLKPGPSLPVMQLEIMPPPGVSMGPVRFNQLALSPDGSLIAFVARDRDGKDKIFLRNFGSGSTVALAGTENGKAPFWSPDSRQIAFLADGRLKRFQLDGNNVVTVAEAATAVYGTWTRKEILISTAEHVLHKVPPAGGTLVPVFPPAQRSSALGATPSAIPGQDTFLYQFLGTQSGLPSGPSSRAVLMSSDGAILKTVLPHPSDVNAGMPVGYAPNQAGGGWLFYRHDLELVARPFDPQSGEFRGDGLTVARDLPGGPSWSTSHTGVLAFRIRGWGDDRKLTWVDRNGAPGESIGEQANVFVPRVSPDGKMIAFTRTGGGVQVYDSIRKTTRRLSLGAARSGYQEWTPDGRRLIYGAGPGARVLTEHPVEGPGATKTLVEPGYDLRPTGISRDGKWLAAAAITVGTPRLVLYSFATRKILPIGEQMKEPSHHGSFSPDSRWLVYSASLNGRWDVFVRPVPNEGDGPAQTAAQRQISPSGGLQPMWRSDGKEIFYISPTGMLTAVPVEISAADVRPGNPTPLFATTLGMDIGFQREYDASADGKRFLLPLQPAGTQAEVPITVIVNWPSLFQKK